MSRKKKEGKEQTGNHQNKPVFFDKQAARMSGRIPIRITEIAGGKIEATESEDTETEEDLILLPDEITTADPPVIEETTADPPKMLEEFPVEEPAIIEVSADAKKEPIDIVEKDEEKVVAKKREMPKRKK